MRIAQDAPARHPFTCRKACARRWKKLERGEKKVGKKKGGVKGGCWSFIFAANKLMEMIRSENAEVSRKPVVDLSLSLLLLLLLPFFFSFSLLPRNTLLLGHVQAQDGSTSGNGWV